MNPLYIKAILLSSPSVGTTFTTLLYRLTAPVNVD